MNLASLRTSGRVISSRRASCGSTMSTTEQLIGFPVYSWTSIRIGDDRFRVGVCGVQALHRLLELFDESEAGRSLFPFRDAIRDVCRAESRIALSAVLVATPDRRVRRIAIWLRGRCGGQLGVEALRRCAQSEDELTRLAAAKALRRLRSWFALREFADDSSKRIRRIVAHETERHFPARLHNYASRVARIATRPTERELYIAPSVDLDRPLRRKAAEAIRRFLERIHQLVRGGAY